VVTRLAPTFLRFGSFEVRLFVYCSIFDVLNEPDIWTLDTHTHTHMFVSFVPDPSFPPPNFFTTHTQKHKAQTNKRPRTYANLFCQTHRLLSPNPRQTRTHPKHDTHNPYLSTPFPPISPQQIFKGTDPFTRRTGPSEGNEPLLRQLLEYAIATYFPHLAQIEPDVERFKAFYQVRSGWVGVFMVTFYLYLYMTSATHSTDHQHPSINYHSKHPKTKTGGGPLHRPPRGRVASGGLHARRAQHGQHEHSGAHHRLRPVWLPGLFRPGLHPQRERQRGAVRFSLCDLLVLCSSCAFVVSLSVCMVCVYIDDG
jgi:hypothetical protein